MKNKLIFIVFVLLVGGFFLLNRQKPEVYVDQLYDATKIPMPDEMDIMPTGLVPATIQPKDEKNIKFYWHKGRWFYYYVDGEGRRVG